MIPTSGDNSPDTQLEAGQMDQKKLVLISLSTKSNIFTLVTCYPWPFCDSGHRRNPKDTKKWIRLDKESVFLGKMIFRLVS